MARFGMVIDTRKCVGCMDCVVACQTENDVPQGFCRDWITTELRGTFPEPDDGDPLGALQPLRQPALRAAAAPPAPAMSRTSARRCR